MYGIFPYIYHKNQSNVGKYTIHGWYGKGKHDNKRFPSPLPFPFLSSELSRSSCLPGGSYWSKMRLFLLICTVRVLNLRVFSMWMKNVSTCKNQAAYGFMNTMAGSFCWRSPLNIEFGMIRKGLLIKGFSKIPSIYQLRRCELNPLPPKQKRNTPAKKTHFRYHFEVLMPRVQSVVFGCDCCFFDSKMAN